MIVVVPVGIVFAGISERHDIGSIMYIANPSTIVAIRVLPIRLSLILNLKLSDAKGSGLSNATTRSLQLKVRSPSASSRIDARERFGFNRNGLHDWIRFVLYLEETGPNHNPEGHSFFLEAPLECLSAPAVGVISRIRMLVQPARVRISYRIGVIPAGKRSGVATTKGSGIVVEPSVLQPAFVKRPLPSRSIPRWISETQPVLSPSPSKSRSSSCFRQKTMRQRELHRQYHHQSLGRYLWLLGNCRTLSTILAGVAAIIVCSSGQRPKLFYHLFEQIHLARTR